MPHARYEFLYRSLPLTLVLISTIVAHAATCPVRAPRKPSPAEQAYLNGDFEHAASLYRDEVSKSPNDTQLITGLVKTLLQQQKVQDADDVIQKALAQQPKSTALQTALGEVQYRHGLLWLAGPTALAVLKADICEPRAHLLAARYLWLSSMYATAAKEIIAAHNLDPNDPEIRLAWIEILPLQDRILHLSSYLAAPSANSSDDIKSLQNELDSLKKRANGPERHCHLVSNTDTTTVPFTLLVPDGVHPIGYGLDVKINDHDSHLQIDTGASGLLVSRSVANRAGLKGIADISIGGVGDHGDKPGYLAYADDIKIGSLEFQDCEVDVLNQPTLDNTDGLIGMDVFSSFLVTLDHPHRKLILAPLPTRPDEAKQSKPNLQTPNTETTGEANPSPSTNSDGLPNERKFHDRYIAPEMKEWTQVYRDGHDLIIPVTLNDKSNKLFVLDTGAYTTSVSPEAAREVARVQSERFASVKGLSGKVNKVYSADDITFKFADLSERIEGVFSFDTSGISKSLGMEISGFIGDSALVQTTMSIDYRDGLVSFSYHPNRGH